MAIGYTSKGTSPYIKINGTSLPPCKRGVSIIVTTLVDSSRNSNGVVVAQKIGRDQYKIDGLEWPVLTCKEWATILDLLSDFFVKVTFTDPVTQKTKTLKMYCGDRQASPYYVKSNSTTPAFYTDCKVNLIDVGA